MVAVGDPSALEAALADAGGTVTSFLEQLVGEPIDAHQRHHRMMPATAQNSLDVAQGHALLHRSAVLRGRMSGRPYVAAESVLVVSRLPRSMYERLEGGSDPIGRLLEEEGIAFTRGRIAALDERARPVLLGGDVAIDNCLLARSYRVGVDGSPVMTVTEWFLPALNDFLVDR